LIQRKAETITTNTNMTEVGSQTNQTETKQEKKSKKK